MQSNGERTQTMIEISNEKHMGTQVKVGQSSD
jgi:hypothetical protein